MPLRPCLASSEEEDVSFTDVAAMSAVIVSVVAAGSPLDFELGSVLEVDDGLWWRCCTMTLLTTNFHCGDWEVGWVAETRLAMMALMMEVFQDSVWSWM